MAEANKLLVVEDETNVGKTLTELLAGEGFSVSWARSIQEATQKVEEQVFELALLDVALPDGSGFDLAATLRKQRPLTALVFLTAFGGAEDRIKGLELGAEDYIVKPFHFKELILRLRKALRRAQYLGEAHHKLSTKIYVGKAEVDFSKFEIRSEDSLHVLTHKECALLRLLVEADGRVVSREEILDRVWSENEYPSTRTVDNFVVRLRRWIETDPSEPKLIRSVRGLGYQLVYSRGMGKNK